MSIIQKFRAWRQRRREIKHAPRLAFLERQIQYLRSENEQLRQTMTECARESAGRIDKTRSDRMKVRSDDLRYNSDLLVRFEAEKKRIERKLGIVAK